MRRVLLGLLLLAPLASAQEPHEIGHEPGVAGVARLVEVADGDGGVQVPGREPESHGNGAGLPRVLRLPAAQPLAQCECGQRNHDHHSGQPGEAAAIRIADGFHQSVGKQRDGEHTG